MAEAEQESSTGAYKRKALKVLKTTVSKRPRRRFNSVSGHQTLKGIELLHYSAGGPFGAQFVS